MAEVRIYLRILRSLSELATSDNRRVVGPLDRHFVCGKAYFSGSIEVDLNLTEAIFISQSLPPEFGSRSDLLQVRH